MSIILIILFTIKLYYITQNISTVINLKEKENVVLVVDSSVILIMTF